MIQEYDMFYKDGAGKRRTDVYKFHCLITTYEVIMQDVELLTSIEWRCCIIDEAHRLKNKNCKLMEGLRCFDLVRRALWWLGVDTRQMCYRIKHVMKIRLVIELNVFPHLHFIATKTNDIAMILVVRKYVAVVIYLSSDFRLFDFSS